MAKTFKPGDHVEWNSEAGRVRGVITKKSCPIYVSKAMCTMPQKTTLNISFKAIRPTMWPSTRGRH